MLRFNAFIAADGGRLVVQESCSTVVPWQRARADERRWRESKHFCCARAVQACSTCPAHGKDDFSMTCGRGRSHLETRIYRYRAQAGGAIIFTPYSTGIMYSHGVMYSTADYSSVFSIKKKEYSCGPTIYTIPHTPPPRARTRPQFPPLTAHLYVRPAQNSPLTAHASTWPTPPTGRDEITGSCGIRLPNCRSKATGVERELRSTGPRLVSSRIEPNGHAGSVLARTQVLISRYTLCTCVQTILLNLIPAGVPCNVTNM